MADVNRACSVSKCPDRIDERSLTAGGNHFLVTRWVAAVRAGTCTKCLPHYLDTDIPTVYSAFIKGADHRGNREKS
jgi:hypothetical protein